LGCWANGCRIHTVIRAKLFRPLKIAGSQRIRFNAHGDFTASLEKLRGVRKSKRRVIWPGKGIDFLQHSVRWRVVQKNAYFAHGGMAIASGAIEFLNQAPGSPPHRFAVVLRAPVNRSAIGFIAGSVPHCFRKRKLATKNFRDDVTAS
jgi:hypothetical protein